MSAGFEMPGLEQLGPVHLLLQFARYKTATQPRRCLAAIGRLQISQEVTKVSSFPTNHHLGVTRFA